MLLSSNCGKTPSIGPSIALLVETKELGQILPSKAEYSEKKVILSAYENSLLPRYPRIIEQADKCNKDGKTEDT